MRTQHRTCGKQAGLINSTLVPPTPLCAQPSSAASLHQQPSYQAGLSLSAQVKHPQLQALLLFPDLNQDCSSLVPPQHSAHVLISKLLHAGCAQIQASHLLCLFSMISSSPSATTHSITCPNVGSLQLLPPESLGGHEWPHTRKKLLCRQGRNESVSSF